MMIWLVDLISAAKVLVPTAVFSFTPKNAVKMAGIFTPIAELLLKDLRKNFAGIDVLSTFKIFHAIYTKSPQ